MAFTVNDFKDRFGTIPEYNKQVLDTVSKKLDSPEFDDMEDLRKKAAYGMAAMDPSGEDSRLTPEDIIQYITADDTSDDALMPFLEKKSTQKMEPIYTEIKNDRSFTQFASEALNILDVGLGTETPSEQEAGQIPVEQAIKPTDQSMSEINHDKDTLNSSPLSNDTALDTLPTNTINAKTIKTIPQPGVSPITKPETQSAPSKSDKSSEPVIDNDMMAPAPNTNHTNDQASIDPVIDTAPETPTTASDELRNRVYSAIDEKAMTQEQATEAKSYADVVLDDPDAYPKEFAALNDSAKSGAVSAGFLRTADRRLGFKNTNASDDRIKFAGGRTTQSRTGEGARSSFVTPEGFGTKKATVMWNQPVITDFGFPFINFSSEALLGVLNAKTDDEAQNSKLKDMFRDAKKRYGGVWKAIYASPLALIRQIARDKGNRCTPCYLKVDGDELINSESGGDITVTPIQYYSVDASFDKPVSIPRDFVSNFYDVIDYSTSSRRTYLKYAYGMTADDFAEAVDDNGGIPPFYILVPKKAVYSRCDIRPGSLFGSLLNMILGRKPCTLIKSMFDGKKGCLVMEEDIADALFADV